MEPVRPKKHLGQHFLKDREIASQIVNALRAENKKVLEIGPGTGILTEFLIQKDYDLALLDIDSESIEYLKKKYPQFPGKIIEADFLKSDLSFFGESEYAVIGNFPYNISSQILFRVLENRDKVYEVVGMFQKEVAQRIASGPGNKDYGILSVFMQTFYEVTYLFSVDEHVFSPPPKVKSGVIQCIRKNNFNLPCDEKKFFKVIKMAFNQRRKTLKNALSAYLNSENQSKVPYLSLRAEQLSWEQFAEITNTI